MPHVIVAGPSEALLWWGAEQKCWPPWLFDGEKLKENTD